MCLILGRNKECSQQEDARVLKQILGKDSWPHVETDGYVIRISSGLKRLGWPQSSFGLKVNINHVFHFRQ